MNVDVTPEGLIAIAAVAMSVLFAYVPGLSNWYKSLEATAKRMVMLGVLVVITLVVFIGACNHWLGGLECSQPGATRLVVAFIGAVMANQSTYSILPVSTSKIETLGKSQE